MMKCCILLALGLTLSFSINSQTLTIQPSSSQGYEAVIVQTNPSFTSPATSLVASYWTAGGVPGAWRSLFKFDLSSLPENAIIDTARLTLRANLTASYGSAGAPTLGTDNAAVLYRVTQNWDKNTVTWNNQPTFNAIESTILPQSTSTTQDYLNIDVKNIVLGMIQSGNYGFAFKMVNENNFYNSKIFYSSQASDPTKRPMLYLTYHNAPLPVQMSFNGKAERNANILYWETYSETNNDHFVLERSVDGKRYVAIANVPTQAPKGNSINEIYYSYDDKTYAEGISYYRLKQIDINGRFVYSSVVTLSNRINPFSFSISPNPATNNIHVVVPEPGLLSVVSLDGKAIIETIIHSPDDIDITNIAPGLYLIYFKGITLSNSLRLIKQ